ncbi:MAG: DUF411 domain-containing protein [Gammaproteobacteria bacterium]|nr:DUF411 domain-containing protein [Gammaproteobacteria bacterium]
MPGSGGIVILAADLVAGLLQTREGEAIEITVYKSRTCGCCNKWIDHLEDNGFRVNAVNRSDMPQGKAKLGVNEKVASCHTAVVGDYLAEGHVPADVVKRLLKERPDVKGILVPGMPIGSPGMDGPNPQHYSIVPFDSLGSTGVYEFR